MLATGIPIVNLELVLERPNLTRVNILANITGLRDSSGTITGAVSIFQDITQLKRAQQEREELLHELGDQIVSSRSFLTPFRTI